MVIRSIHLPGVRIPVLLVLVALLEISQGSPTPEDATVPSVPPVPVPVPSTNPAPLPQCSKVTCTAPPEGLKCNKTEIKNPSLLKKVGKLKDCCFAWRCQEEDGSFSTYFGMTGTESVAGKKNNSTTTKKPTDPPPPPPTEVVTTPTTTTTTTTTTPKPTTKKITTETPPPPTTEPRTDNPIENKCTVARAKCPMPEEDMDSCTVTMSKDAMQFKPKGELDSCCPIYNCTRSDGSYSLHYLMSGGVQPKKQSAITKEKGEPTEGSKCPNLQCAQEPQAGEDGPVCVKSPTSETESPRIKELGPFRECCDFWKCTYPDTSYYIHFELQATSFWLAETTFQSEPASVTVNAGDVEQLPENPTTTEKPPISGDEVVAADPVPIPIKPAAKPLPHKPIAPPGPGIQNTKTSFKSQGGYASSFSNSFSNSSSWSAVANNDNVVLDGNDDSQTQDTVDGQQEGQDQNEGDIEGQDLVASSDDTEGQTQDEVVGQDVSGYQTPRKTGKVRPQPDMGMGGGGVPGMGGMGMPGMGMGGMMMQQQMMMPPMNMYGPRMMYG